MINLDRILKRLVFAAVLSAAFLGISVAHAQAQYGLQFVEVDHGATESAYAVFGNEPALHIAGVAVTPISGVGHAWRFDLNGSGHSIDGGDFVSFGAWAWVEPAPSPLFNNLYFLGNNVWQLDSEQPVAVPNTANFFNIPGFALGTSLYAGVDSYDGSQMFASVMETTAVPEPETYAMLLAGLGLLGFVARRRKQIAA